MLSSEFDGERSGTETPITSADSRRVETEDWRRWCEWRLVSEAEEERVGEEEEEEVSLLLFVAGKEKVEREETEVLREWERPWLGLDEGRSFPKRKEAS
jgi:hypothetical protein